MSSKTKNRKLKCVVIREELVALTEHYIAALALNQFLYWSERRKDFDAFIQEEKQRDPKLKADLTHGWIYKSVKELHEELMLDPTSTSTLRRHVDDLVEEGWLDRRHNPRYNWDRTWQYRPNIFQIQRDLFELGYVLAGYPLQFDESILQGEKSNFQDEKSKCQSEKTIPETTSEITTKKTVSPEKQKSKTEDPLEAALEAEEPQSPREQLLLNLGWLLEREVPDDPYRYKPWEQALDSISKGVRNILDKSRFDSECAAVTKEAMEKLQFKRGEFPLKNATSPTRPVIEVVLDAVQESQDSPAFSATEIPAEKQRRAAAPEALAELYV